MSQLTALKHTGFTLCLDHCLLYVDCTVTDGSSPPKVAFLQWWQSLQVQPHIVDLEL